MLTTLDTLINRNTERAVEQTAIGVLPRPPLKDALRTLKAIVIGCVDLRIDPVDVLGLEPGEAIVIRNIGGRVTPATFEIMGLLATVAQVETQIPGAGADVHLIVLHHTDCGITRLDGHPALLAQYFGIDQEALKLKSVMDPRKSVIADIDEFKANPALPDGWLVSGLVYDITTGLVEVVVPPAPLR